MYKQNIETCDLKAFQVQGGTICRDPRTSQRFKFEDLFLNVKFYHFFNMVKIFVQEHTHTNDLT